MYRLVIMGFSYEIANYGKCSKHNVASARHEIKRYAQSKSWLNV
jgi:hypothetical protein